MKHTHSLSLLAALSIITLQTASADPNTRRTRNIRTGATIKVKATSVPAFRAGAGYKETAPKAGQSAKPQPARTPHAKTAH